MDRQKQLVNVLARKYPKKFQSIADEAPIKREPPKTELDVMRSEMEALKQRLERVESVDTVRSALEVREPIIKR